MGNALALRNRADALDRHVWAIRERINELLLQAAVSEEEAVRCRVEANRLEAWTLRRPA